MGETNEAWVPVLRQISSNDLLTFSRLVHLEQHLSMTGDCC